MFDEPLRMKAPLNPSAFIPELTCVCMTYGRFSRLRNALACFLAQDIEMGRIEMIIYLFGDEPLHYDDARDGYAHFLRIINEPNHGTVTEIWPRMLSFVETPFIRPVFDDDLFLPHACRQGLENIGHAAAFKEKHFYIVDGNKPPELTSNVAEGSLTIRTDVAKKVGLNYGEGIAIPGTRVLDLPPSWVFFWNDGLYHSESISRKIPPEARNRMWRNRHNDHPRGRPLTPGEGLKKMLPVLPPYGTKN